MTMAPTGTQGMQGWPGLWDPDQRLPELLAVCHKADPRTISTEGAGARPGMCVRRSQDHPQSTPSWQLREPKAWGTRKVGEGQFL